jgi:acyl-CoA reductase-like NAD-dependent aldehyde dehydrogenase
MTDKPFPTSPIETRLFIDGSFVSSSNPTKTFPITNPYILEVIAHVHQASPSDTDLAVTAASEAFPS